VKIAQHGAGILLGEKRARHVAARWSCHVEEEIIPQFDGTLQETFAFA
jgi:hypothetical protein